MGESTRGVYQVYERTCSITQVYAVMQNACARVWDSAMSCISQLREKTAVQAHARMMNTWNPRTSPCELWFLCARVNGI